MINIFGIIGEDVQSKDIFKQIQNEKGDTIEVNINSIGGNIFDGLAIFDSLRSSGKKIKTNIIGLVASAGSIIAMAGDEILMGENSMIMIHNSSSPCGGNAEQMKSLIPVMEKIDERMTAIYSKRTGLSMELVAELMKKETYINSKEALSHGFITSLESDIKLVALATAKKQNGDKIMPIENEEKVSVGAVTKILMALGLKNSSIQAMEQEEETKPAEEVVVEEVKEDEEIKALKAEIESLKAKLQAMEEVGKDKEKEEEEMQVEAKSKTELIFNALNENKVTVSKAKEFFAMGSSQIAEALKSLDNNATKFGANGTPDKKGTADTAEGIYALYQSANGADKTKIFNQHKSIIIAQASNKGK